MLPRFIGNADAEGSVSKELALEVLTPEAAARQFLTSLTERSPNLRQWYEDIDVIYPPSTYDHGYRGNILLIYALAFPADLLGMSHEEVRNKFRKRVKSLTTSPTGEGGITFDNSAGAEDRFVTALGGILSEFLEKNR